MYWMWLVVIPLSQAIFNNKLKFHARFLLYGITVMTFYDALIKQNDWKSGWFPAAVVIAVLFGLRFKKLVLLGIPFALFIGGAFITELISTDFYSWSTRLDAWVIVLGISRVSPLWGLGFANYYWYTILFPIRGWAVSFNSHNQFVDLIGQTGIAGLLCFLWVFFEVGRLSWKLMKRLPDGFAKGYAFGVFAGVCGSLVASSLGDWLLPFPYNIGLTGLRASILPWIFFGGLISIEQLYSEKPSEKI